MEQQAVREASGPGEQPVRGRALLVAIAGLAVAYGVTAELSLQLALVGRSVTPLWPPTGIAVAALLFLGARVWPGVWAAAFLVNLPISPNWLVAAAIATGNTLAPLVATLLLRRVAVRPQLDRTRDALALVFLGALAAMTVSATIGTASLDLAGALGSTGFWRTWSVWWTGDAMGVLAVAPVLLIAATRPWRPPRTWRDVREAAIFVALLGLAVYLVVLPRAPMRTAVFPILVWVAWRYRQPAAAPAALVIIAAGTWATAQGLGPLADQALGVKMVATQVFNASVAFTSFFFAAVVEDRIRLQESERETQLALYRRERKIAEVLQRSLLPERLAGAPDVAVAARYLPSTAEAEVGGDWYDLVPLADGRFGLVIGDVAGHGLPAAATMGQMRMALRAYALEGLPPGEILGRLNTLLHEFQPESMATVLYAELDPESGRVVAARAGHPPALIAHPDGQVTELAGDVAPPLGAWPLATYVDAVTTLPVGATLYLYTDGLVERRGESLEVGLASVRAAIGAAAGDLDAGCDAIVATLLSGTTITDDVALLAVRRLSLAGRPIELHIPAVPARLAPTRRVLARWLRQNGVEGQVAEEILLACGEACTNAVQHAYGSGQGWLDVRGAAADGAVRITVRDSGRWKRPSGDGGAEVGRGILLMERLMDRVEVVRTASGTEVLLQRGTGDRHG